MKLKHLLLVILQAFMVKAACAQVSSGIKEVCFAGTSLHLYGPALSSKKNPFTAYLKTTDGVIFNLNTTEITKKKITTSVIVDLPFINEASIFTLYTYGGNVPEDNPQRKRIMMGLNPLDDGSSSNYWIEDEYETGTIDYSLASNVDIEDLKGDNGDNGPKGDSGAKGATGAAGADGTVTFTGGSISGATTFSSTSVLNSSFRMASGAGANKVLTSDASGNFSWANQSSAGAGALDDMAAGKITSTKTLIGGGHSTSLYLNNNALFGVDTMATVLASDFNNINDITAFGSKAVSSVDNMSQIVAFGSNTIGAESTYTIPLTLAVGAYAAGSGSHDYFSVIIGKEAGYAAAGRYNSFLGNDVARNVAGGFCGFATAVGNGALLNTENYFGVVAIGSDTGKNISGYKTTYVIIGHNSGTTAMTNGSVLIGHDNELPGGFGDNSMYIADLLYIDNSKVGINTTSIVRTLNVSDVMRLQSRSTAPSSPSLGDLYVDSDSNELCFYDGSSWTGLSAAAACS